MEAFDSFYLGVFLVFFFFYELLKIWYLEQFSGCQKNMLCGSVTICDKFTATPTQKCYILWVVAIITPRLISPYNPTHACIVKRLFYHDTK